MDFKSKLKAIKKLVFNEEEIEGTFIDARTVDGRIMRTEELIKDSKIQEVTEEGIIDVDPGEYELEGGIFVVVGEGSIITEIKEVEEVKEETFANLMRTDGVAIYYDGTDLVKGTELYLDEAMTEKVPEGEHFLEGDLRIVVDAEGKLELIEEVKEETEEEVVEEQMKEVNFNSEIIEIIEKLAKELQEIKEKLAKELEVIKEDFLKFKKEPSVKPTNVKKIEFGKEMDKFEKLKYFSKRK